MADMRVKNSAKLWGAITPQSLMYKHGIYCIFHPLLLSFNLFVVLGSWIALLHSTTPWVKRKFISYDLFL